MKNLLKIVKCLELLFLIIAILLVIFNIFLLIFPQIVLQAARDGLLLWFHNVLPSLLPFMIATNMLILLGFANIVAKIFAPLMKKVFRLPGVAAFGLITGLTSGYPMGAKTVADLRQENQLTPSQAQHLLSFSNNAGPLFILGVVGVGLFGNVKIGYVLWAGHIFSALILGLIFKPNEYSVNANLINRENTRSNMHSRRDVGKILSTSVKNSMEALTFIGGLIIFFSVVIAVFSAVGLPENSFFGGIFAGLIEVTSGSRRLAQFFPSYYTLAAVAFVVAFGGLSVHAQSLHFLSGTGVNVRAYFFAKLLHGVLAAGVTVLIWYIVV
jgi:sporulation integral membrane protein YlbJ